MCRAEKCLHRQRIDPHGLSNLFRQFFVHAIDFYIAADREFIVVSFSGKLFQKIIGNAFGANVSDDGHSAFIFINNDDVSAVRLDDGCRPDLGALAVFGRKGEIRMMIRIGNFSARIFLDVGNRLSRNILVLFGKTFRFGNAALTLAGVSSTVLTVSAGALFAAVLLTIFASVLFAVVVVSDEQAAARPIANA